MNNKKCPNCGFINFATAEACRKCETSLSEWGESDQTSSYDAPRNYRGGTNTNALPYPTKRRTTAGQIFASVAGLALAAIFYTGVTGLIRGNANVNWIEYHPAGQSITVMMPNEPTLEQPTLPPLPAGSVSMHTFTSDVSGQGAAVFGYADYAGVEIGDSSQALENGLSGLVKKSNSTLISKTPINYQGLPGLEFELTPPESAGIRNGHGYGKILLDHNRVYMLVIAAGENTALIAGKDKFLNPELNNGSRPAVISVPSIAPIQTPPPVYQSR
jgi:hypothetical protein